jgi:Tol biopolymer transport system component
MQKDRASQFSVFNLRSLVAFGLCSAAVVLTVFSFATSPSEMPYPRPGTLTKMLAANAGSTNSQVPVAVSADGRYLAFSGAFPGACCVVGIYDRQTGTTNAPVVSTGGTFALSFSADGRYLAYSTNGYNIYVFDQQTGSNTRVSVGYDGSPPASNYGGPVSSWYPSISADGRYVGFYSFATNLVNGVTVTNQTANVYVRDTQTNVTELVSVASNGTQANGLSAEESISADGRYVAFRSRATNLVTGNSNTGTDPGGASPSDIYVHDRQTGTTELVSVGLGGTQDGGSWGPSISSDGRYVAFTSAATTLVPVDGNGAWDVFVRDRLTGTTERVSVSSDGVEGTCTGCSIKNSSNPAISPDGRYVVFTSGASNLVPGDTNNDPDIFVHDRETGATERVSIATDGTQGNSTSGPFIANAGLGPAISGDGRITVFDSFASNWVPGDPNPKFYTDVFMRDRGPAVGIGALNAACSARPATASGWATFSGEVLSGVDDPSPDGGTAAAQVSAELIGASLAYRPEHADLFVQLRLASLPSKLGGAPGVVYGFKITAGGIPYEVRAAQGENMGSPLFALYNCQSTPCTQVAALAGSMGTTGNDITASVPLSALGANEGDMLSGLDAYTALGSATAGPAVTLDDDPLPSPTTIPVHSVSLGIAPTGTPEANVSFNTPANLASGSFSGTLPPTPPGTYDVWARACLGSSCGNAVSAPLTVSGACAAPPVQLNSVVSRKVHGTAGTFDVALPLTGSPGIECRSGGANGDYALVFTFSNTLTSVTGASISSGAGSVSSRNIDSTDAHNYIVNLTGVANAQYITVSLANVTDSAGDASSTVSAQMGVLIGDTTADRFVNSADISQTKSQSGQAVTASNFREDVNTDGFLNSADISLVKSRSGTALQ